MSRDGVGDYLGLVQAMREVFPYRRLCGVKREIVQLNTIIFNNQLRDGTDAVPTRYFRVYLFWKGLITLNSPLCTHLTLAMSPYMLIIGPNLKIYYSFDTQLSRETSRELAVLGYW